MYVFSKCSLIQTAAKEVQRSTWRVWHSPGGHASLHHILDKRKPGTALPTPKIPFCVKPGWEIHGNPLFWLEKSSMNLWRMDFPFPCPMFDYRKVPSDSYEYWSIQVVAIFGSNWMACARILAGFVDVSQFGSCSAACQTCNVRSQGHQAMQ